MGGDLIVFDDDGALLGEQMPAYRQDMKMWRTAEGDWFKLRSRDCGESFDVELRGTDPDGVELPNNTGKITREQARALCTWLDAALGYR